MVCGTSLNLRLRRAARLQDIIRSLGKFRKGGNDMTEAIQKAEELFCDVVDGSKPLIHAARGGYLLMGMAANKNAECRLMEYGLVDETKEKLVEALRQNQ